jgi:hypothetical protein
VGGGSGSTIGTDNFEPGATVVGVFCTELCLVYLWVELLLLLLLLSLLLLVFVLGDDDADSSASMVSLDLFLVPKRAKKGRHFSA